MNPNILTHTIHSSYIFDGRDIRDITTTLRATDTLWIYYYSTFRIQNDDHLIYLVHRFFKDIPGIEPFFYYMMSKRLLVDEMMTITTTYVSNLRSVIVIAHIIDGWEDFFLRSDYTLFADEENELESYRIKIYHVLNLLVPFLGEDVNELHPYYKTRLCDYFLIRIGESIVVEGENVGEQEESEEEENDEEDIENNVE
jgi:hypothetical protein